MPRASRTDGVCARRNGLVRSSRSMVVGTVGSPLARRASMSLERSTSALFFGSTPRENRAFVCVYSWAQKTSVSGGREVIRSRDALAIAGVPSKRRPQPSANSASPTKIMLSSGKWKAMWPVVCPGTSMTSTRVSPRLKESPPFTPWSIPGMRARSTSAPTTVQPKIFFSSRLPPAWSLWWCVLRMCVSFQPAASHARFTAAASGVSTAAVSPVAWSCNRNP
mmetsp:Transcript_16875/g.48882  ORF Transcript_16875/g.48882 Transcript_16875/m.48882 type:complete len:222 (+) Transcript_16875:333-998(+)